MGPGLLCSLRGLQHEGPFRGHSPVTLPGVKVSGATLGGSDRGDSIAEELNRATILLSPVSPAPENW